VIVLEDKKVGDFTETDEAILVRWRRSPRSPSRKAWLYQDAERRRQAPSSSTR
jgi:hypothetical protein